MSSNYKCFLMEQKTQREILTTNQRTQKKNLLSRHADELAALAEQHRYEITQLQSNLALARQIRKLNATQSKTGGKRKQDESINEPHEQVIIEDISSDNEAPVEKKLKSSPKENDQVDLTFTYAANNVVKQGANQTISAKLRDLTNTYQSNVQQNNAINVDKSTNIPVETRKIAMIPPRPKFLPITKQLVNSMQMQYRPCNSTASFETDDSTTSHTLIVNDDTNQTESNSTALNQVNDESTRSSSSNSMLLSSVHPLVNWQMQVTKMNKIESSQYNQTELPLTQSCVKKSPLLEKVDNLIEALYSQVTPQEQQQQEQQQQESNVYESTSSYQLDQVNDECTVSSNTYEQYESSVAQSEDLVDNGLFSSSQISKVYQNFDEYKD